MSEAKWRLHYRKWTGVWLGPIPIGLLIGAIGFTWIYFTYYHGTF